MNVNGLRLKKITLNDGSAIDLNKNSIVALTGPNNCGKSQCLRDIVYNYFSSHTDSVVIRSIEPEFIGSTKSLVEEIIKRQFGLLDENDLEILAGKSAKRNSDDKNLNPYDLLKRITFGNTFLHNAVIKYYMTFLNTASRLTGFNEQIARHISMNSIEKYHMEQVALKDVFEDVELEEKIHNMILSSFGTGILLNRYAFKQAAFQYVSRSSFKDRNDVGRPSFARWFEERRALDQQGDGLVSFCNILISILSSKCPLLLLDEPEAFFAFAPDTRSSQHHCNRNKRRDTGYNIHPFS